MLGGIDVTLDTYSQWYLHQYVFWASFLFCCDTALTVSSSLFIITMTENLWMDFYEVWKISILWNTEEVAQFWGFRVSMPAGHR